MTSKKPENSGKKQGGDTRFKPGKSGNPAGKPKGARHKVTLLAEKLLDGDAEDVVKKCIELAKAGDSSAIKLIMDRILPARKDRTVNIDLPPIKSISDASKAMAQITTAVSEGEITPMESQILSSVLENYRKVVETVNHEERIAELEKVKAAGNIR